MPSYQQFDCQILEQFSMWWHSLQMSQVNMHQSVWIPRVTPMGRPRGFWHLTISPLKVLHLSVRIPSIPLSYWWKSMYIKCQNCSWVWTSYSLEWNVRKLSECPVMPVRVGLGFHTDWCIMSEKGQISCHTWKAN